MSFQIIRNDITKVAADAIVNTANPLPTYGSGTDQAIYEAAGKDQLLAARKIIGEIAPGEAFETKAFNLEAKYIIHTVGPAWNGGESGEFDILKSCYENSLKLALKLECKSIAFPLIATGIYGFPKDKALDVAMSVIEPFIEENDMQVILVVFDKKAFELSGNLVDNIREYVDSNYVEEVTTLEYGADIEGAEEDYRRGKEPYRTMNVRGISASVETSSAIEKSRVDRKSLMDYLKERPSTKKEKKTKTKYMDESCEEDLIEPLEEDRICKMQFPSAAPSKVRIDDLIASSEKTFQEKLFEMIDSRGLTGPQVYNGYVSKQVYSKIQADKYYHPNKYTALAFCLSLHLDIDETQDLLGRAGWTLSPSNKSDLVVRGCILNKEYNKVKIDLILFDYDCPELEKIK